MKVRADQKMPRRVEDPRVAVVNRLLSMAELNRMQGKHPDAVQEALDWEKKLFARKEDLLSSPLAKAA